jgi:hypothetical protein
MKNEFIPYEQALALKELGFDEPCFVWFDPRYFRVGCFESEHVQGLGGLPAPLYQQAFRWFREKCGLRHFIEYDNGHYNAVVQSSLVYHNDNYEEAELACLKKLIEISTKTA